MNPSSRWKEVAVAAGRQNLSATFFAELQRWRKLTGGTIEEDLQRKIGSALSEEPPEKWEVAGESLANEQGIESAVSVLAASAGNNWNNELWLTRRQRLVEFPSTYGGGTDLLLEDATARSRLEKSQAPRSLRERVTQFRMQYGGSFSSSVASRVCADTA